jgi:hypothetical protein
MSKFSIVEYEESVIYTFKDIPWFAPVRATKKTLKVVQNAKVRPLPTK